MPRPDLLDDPAFRALMDRFQPDRPIPEFPGVRDTVRPETDEEAAAKLVWTFRGMGSGYLASTFGLYSIDRCEGLTPGDAFLKVTSEAADRLMKRAHENAPSSSPASGDEDGA